jgi:hypothetical protein
VAGCNLGIEVINSNSQALRQKYLAKFQESAALGNLGWFVI